MLTPANLIAQIVADLQAVPGIGLVYDRRRDVRDEPTARAIWYHEGQNRIHAWSVSLGEPAVNVVRAPGFGPRASGQAGQVFGDIGIVIEAVFGIDDANASEVTFRNLVWDVQTRFNAIGLITADVVKQEPLRWERFGYLALAGMWRAHYAKLTCRYAGKLS
jgi:hypothetical protein